MQSESSFEEARGTRTRWLSSANKASFQSFAPSGRNRRHSTAMLFRTRPSSSAAESPAGSASNARYTWRPKSSARSLGGRAAAVGTGWFGDIPGTRAPSNARADTYALAGPNMQLASLEPAFSVIVIIYIAFLLVFPLRRPSGCSTERPKEV